MSVEVHLSLSRATDTLRRSQVALRQLGVEVVPFLPPDTPQPLMDALADMQFRTIACRDAVTAERLSGCGTSSALWLLQRQQQAPRLAAVADRWRGGPVTVLVDHFVHVEELATAAGLADAQLGALIEVNANPDQPGLRPGHEATLLAAAAAAQEGVRVDGVISGNENALWTGCGPHTPTGIQETLSGFHTTVTMLARRQLSLRHLAVWQTTVPVGAQWQTGLVTDMVCSVPLVLEEQPQTLGSPSAALTVRSRVVGRPSLTTAVINVGTDLLGHWREPPQVIAPDGAVPIQAGCDWMSLRLARAARDLVIGDPVLLAVSATPHVLRRAQLTD